MTAIHVAKEAPEEFLSDILITAFDGSYGASWAWFIPAECEGREDHSSWLVTKHPEGHTSTDNPWMECHVRVNPVEPTGIALIDANQHIVVDHQGIANGISRILNDDYVDVWRTATAHEYARWTQEFASCDFDHGVMKVSQREWRRNPKNRTEIQVHTGETARGLKPMLAAAVADMEAGDVDAPLADCIVQCAVFGKVIFG